MKLLAALLPLLQNLIVRLITALGITAVTYVGFERIVSNFKSEITQSLSGVPNDLLQFFYISGGGVALNILFGAFTFYISLIGLTKLTTKLGGK
ncbi:DUF2523 domain-containing protein [Wielerella bovis]|uniref:DUF2523 domain-containing protein n=1 Tax=Wielerella bovis TaxID=2917790 RepID=UPI0020189B38|nr:DUF2523 domain-containing protein [Wielerella bovis]ULJ64609.1 DUF2523 domain-containing protein [Wielerella bovis]